MACSAPPTTRRSSSSRTSRRTSACRAPFNAWMTFFGQFFDHGLDLVTKGGNGTIFIPLKPDDPLVPDRPGRCRDQLHGARRGPPMLPGPDGVLGTADDIHEQENTTTPFVDQNQTYSSHPSHQVFLRAYELDADGQPRRDRQADHQPRSGRRWQVRHRPTTPRSAAWRPGQVVKAQARDLLGINLTDANVFDVPLLATDALWQLHQGPARLPAWW